MEKEALRLVIVGSVDHGKSTLIGRLFYDTDSLPEGKMEEIQAASEAEGKEVEFGFIMDHLREERQRGMTIDTARAFFSTDKRDYIIIDAPGHKEFLKNMLTGASQADAAVLICSAYEGVEEQTRRHVYLLRLLGLNQIIVAYNKMDLVGYERRRFEKVRADLHKFLRRIDIMPTLEVPISAKLGENIASRSPNMPWYDGPTILEGLDRFVKSSLPTEKPVRLPIQDVYELDGQRVAVGRVESGILKRGQTLCFLPSGGRKKVTEIRKFGEQDVEQAGAGECIGVLFDSDPPGRGAVGCQPEHLAEPTESFEASVFWLAGKPLKRGEPLTVRCSTQEKACSVGAIRERVDSSTLEHTERDADALEETEVGELSINTQSPIVVEKFQEVPELGRFVLLRGRDVVAGGIVTSAGA
jgi:sulfate adenylyltransferase large subunit